MDYSVESKSTRSRDDAFQLVRKQTEATMQDAAGYNPRTLQCGNAGRQSMIAGILASIRRFAVVLIAVMSGLPSNSMADDVKEDSTGQRPLVYSVENTGAGFPAPVLPAIADLPTVAPLTDPLMWSNGSGRVTKFDEWSRRRAEIKAEIEHYEIGK